MGNEKSRPQRVYSTMQQNGELTAQSGDLKTDIRTAHIESKRKPIIDYNTIEEGNLIHCNVVGRQLENKDADDFLLKCYK